MSSSRAQWRNTEPGVKDPEYKAVVEEESEIKRGTFPNGY